VVAGPGGRWIEVIPPRVERFETIFGRRSRPEGVAVLAEGFSDAVTEHAYWGGMRDRMPASQTTTRCTTPAGVEVERDGERVRVRPRGSVCLIRSGQDWTGCDDDERATYLERVEPNLRRGMDFLRDQGGDVGCFRQPLPDPARRGGPSHREDLRAGVVAHAGRPERWSESHPTHLAIFGAFMKMATRGARDQAAPLSRGLRRRARRAVVRVRRVPRADGLLDVRTHKRLNNSVLDIV
jgi:aldoxime dehydratase